MDQMKDNTAHAREKDIKIFEEILSICSENTARDFVDCLNFDALYRKEHSKMLNVFIIKSKDIGWNFFNTQVQDYFENLKEARNSLDSFLIEHFFVVDNNFVLYPKHIKRKLWVNRKKELAPLVKAFDHAYVTFVRYSRNILYKEENTQIPTRSAPGTKIKGQHRYIVIGKRKIKIAKESTRQSRLWKELTDSFGIPRKLEWVFGKIWLTKDDKNKLLQEGHTAPTEQKKIIENSIGVLQKILSQKKIRQIQFNLKNGEVWMSWREKIK